jgi:hypothetical protein
LSINGSHMNVAGTCVATTDVAQVLTANTLLYIPNSSTTASYGFDMQATSALSSEHSRINGATIIGIGDRTSSLAVGVRCSADVRNVSIDATMDNLGTCVSAADTNRVHITAGSRLTNYNTRSVGFYNVGSDAAAAGAGVSVDGSLQMEVNGTDRYDRDMYREQLRVESFTHLAAAADEDVTQNLTRPFRTDTSCLVASFGAPASGVSIYTDLPNCTASAIRIRLEGMTIGVTYRINYIAYGY